MRRKLCKEDSNIRSYLLYSAFKRLHGQSIQKNIKALANIIARFFEPLWELLNAKTTSEILTIKNAPLILNRLSQFGGLCDFKYQTQRVTNQGRFQEVSGSRMCCIPKVLDSNYKICS
jgi:hypothetical protein